MYYTNMLNIPQDLYESATIDGAGSFKQFIYITFPLLRGTHITLIILDILGALKFFDLSYVLTDGGPAHATETCSTYIYTKSFSTFQQGQASTIVIYVPDRHGADGYSAEDLLQKRQEGDELADEKFITI